LHSSIIQLSGQIVPINCKIDHKDQDKLNNLESNLRICTQAQNAQNSKLRSDSTSGWTGVSLFKHNRKYEAHITLNGKKKHIGYFKLAEDAARAYNTAALKYFGEFEVLNNVT